MRGFLKDNAAGVLYATGLSSCSVRNRARGRALILAYHHIIPRKLIQNNSLMPGMYLSSEAFGGQLDWLAGHFSMVSLKKIVEKIKAGLPWKDSLCAITFDDGWKDVYDNALPLLRKYAVPATVFSVGTVMPSRGPVGLDGVFEVIQMANNSSGIVSGIPEIDAIIRSDAIPDSVEKARQVINMIRDLPYDRCAEVCERVNRYLQDLFDIESVRWKYETMSWEEMRKSQGQGIDFGYHSKSHPILTKIPSPLLDLELSPPLEDYEKEGLHLNPLFCYPDGKFSDEAIAVLEDEGYEGAVTLQKGFNDYQSDTFLLKRVNIHEGNGGSMARFLFSIGLQNR